MPKSRLFFCFLLSLFSSFLKSQTFSTVRLEDKPFYHLVKKNKEIVSKLEKNTVYTESTKDEQEFIYWTNHARLYPKSFSDSVLIPFIESQPSTKGVYADQLIMAFNKINPLPFLSPEKTLSELARSHSMDLSKKQGRISHSSNDGSSFSTRMLRAGIKTCAAENISLGQQDQLIALLLLYLDIGLPDAGHRANLMNPSFTQMGVGVLQIKGGQYITVQDFSCPTR
jgi:uncharacterized protein YkwD